jgi:phosphoribosylcarboxyaminoimidazole (NCAIR) mutase
MTDEAVPAAATAGEAVPDPTVAALEQELAASGVLVGIVMGSQSDMGEMEKAAKELTARGIEHEVNVMSAHRDPDTVSAYAKNARSRGLKVIIAGAGLSAALPGVVAAHTDLPVIGVPLTSRMCVGVDNAKNAAVLAARILAA